MHVTCMPKSLLTFLLLLTASCPALCQARADTTFIVAARNHAFDVYEQALGTQRRLNNGSKYVAPTQTFEQHPYFHSADWIMGDVLYDGEHFANVPLMLDLSSNTLITEHRRSGHAIELVKEKLENFTIDGHYFEKIENSSVNNSLPRSGFYDVLHNGESKLIGFYQKFARDKVDFEGIERSFDERIRYYLFKNNTFFPVKSKSSALRIFSDKKQQLKRLLKEHKVDFVQDRASALKKVAAFYDSLNAL